MHNVGGVASICWIPADVNHPSKKDPVTGKLRGKYVFKVRALDRMVNNDYASCPTFEVHPDMWWVEENVQAQYLATAQRIACDMSEWIQPEGQKYDEQGFVDVSCLNLVIPIDNDPVNKLKYIPPKLDKDNNEKAAEQWYGYCNSANKKVPLDTLYINTHFEKGLIEDIKRFGVKGSHKWIDIPPGEARPRSGFPEHLEKGPLVKYRQEEGQNTCLVYSFASALDHIGAKQAAFVLYRKSQKIINRIDTVARFCVAVKETDKHFNFVKLKPSSFDILHPVDNQLAVASLRGSDGKEEHSVTIFDKWVFDSNFEYALPLSREALDLCCSSEETQDQFVSVAEARLCKYTDVLDSKKRKQQAQAKSSKRKKK